MCEPGRRRDNCRPGFFSPFLWSPIMNDPDMRQLAALLLLTFGIIGGVMLLTWLAQQIV